MNEVETNEVDANAMGGTEILKFALHEKLDQELLSKFQIISSRVRKIDPDRKTILWLHDLPEDPESKHLANYGWKRYDGLVFVSHWQQQQYHDKLGVPYSAGVVIQNAIEPIPVVEKENDVIKLIYHSTPHRGLELLYPVFEHLQNNWIKDGLKVELDVYSSFKLYGWEERDKQYKALFEKLDSHPDINNHGTVSNDEIRTALQKAHIFAYPSIWKETSCLCLIEAMSAKVLCVHSSLAALPETSAKWTQMYPYVEDPNQHANIFALNLDSAVRNIQQNDTGVNNIMNSQKIYMDIFYNWERRIADWTAYLQSKL